MRSFNRRMGTALIVLFLVLLPAVSIVVTGHSHSTAKLSLSYGPGFASTTACDNVTCVAHSNASLTQFFYTETTHTFNLTISGSLGTAGYVNITIPNSIISDPSRIAVIANGNRVSGSALTLTSNSKSYFLFFTVNFPNSSNSNIAATIQPYLIVGAVVSVSLVILLIKTRRIQISPSIKTKRRT